VAYYLESGKNWKVRETDPRAFNAIARQSGITELSAKILINRGIKTAKDVKDFLAPSSKILTEPSLIPDIKKAADRIHKAIKDGELIYVYGDYDVDGITSTTLLFEALGKLKANVRYYVPCRFKDGYGLNKKAIDNFAKEGAKLLVTVDCGIKSFSEVNYAKKKGMDVIITDHHEPAESWPDAYAVIDPKLPHCESKNDYLAGVGVALKLAQELCNDPLEELYDLVALGTVADIAPLLAENRYLAKQGIELLNKNPRLGVTKLAALAGAEKRSINSGVIGFTLSPRLNAGGRMANASVCVELLTTQDEARASEIAKSLEDANRKRKDIGDKMLEEVLDNIEKEVDIDNEKVIFVADKGWHDGIKGIIASRVKERFFRPAFVGTIKQGQVKASARSIPNFSINDALQNCSELLVDFGGHKMAGGGGGKKKKRGGGERNALADEWLDDKDLHPTISIDAEVDFDELSPAFESELKKLEPFGEANEHPSLLLNNVYVKDQKRLGKKGNHMRLNISKGERQLEAVGFSMDSFASVLSHQGKADIVVKPDFNEYNSRTYFRTNIVDIKLHSLEIDDRKSVVEHLFANRQSIAAKEEYKNIGDAESFFTKLAGVSFDGRQDLINGLKKDTPLNLKREPENEHDPNAIRVLTKNNDDLGFLNKRLAKQLAPFMDAGEQFDCRVTDVTGGNGEKNFGVNIVVSKYESSKRLEVKQKLKFKNADQALEAVKEKLLPGNDFHEHQEITLEHLLAGKNSLALMGTGRGKSAIFHTVGALKALLENKMSIFLYPLRSLITDQYLFLSEALESLGINVVRLSGDCPIGERENIFKAMAEGRIDIVLTTPEFLHHNAGSFGALDDKIGFLVLDEAHHISMATQTHRPLYKGVNNMVQKLSNPLVMAATATADEQTAKEIVDKLKIQETIIDATVRKNLSIVDKREIDNKEAYLKELLEKGSKLLVYVNSRQKGAEVANTMRYMAPGFEDKVVYYHAGLNDKLRTAVQSGFTESDFSAVVATSAFGEGVNIPDITDIVLYHLPFNFVEYNQQSGRAGRDGRNAAIHLLFGDEDARINDFVLESSAPGRDTLASVWKCLKVFAGEKDQIFESNSDIVDQLSTWQPHAGYNNRTIASSLKIFKELGLIEVGRIDSGRTVILNKNKKVQLEDSVVYEEGLHEKEEFKDFREWALSANVEKLLGLINQPIYPKADESSKTPLASVE